MALTSEVGEEELAEIGCLVVELLVKTKGEANRGVRMDRQKNPRTSTRTDTSI